MAAIEDSRPPERDSLVYQTIHNLEIPNLAVTVIIGQKTFSFINSNTKLIFFLHLRHLLVP